MKVVVLASVGCGGVGGGIGGGINGVAEKRRVMESGVDDRVDRETRNLFGFAGKIQPEKFSGGDSVVAAVAAAGGLGWPDFWWGDTRMFRDLSLRTSGPK
nr:hypothetical protein [Tanacetum cinerariifolium]